MRKVTLAILSLIYDRKYLRGRYFEISKGGFYWAIKSFWLSRVLRVASAYPWPTCINCTISNPKNITFHPDDLNNFQSPGVYFQNFSGHITLGKGCYIAPNVGLITSNHDPDDLTKHLDSHDISIGEECWIGMNSVILPGVVLGRRVTVAAGSVVTKSFPEGDLVIGGVPARVLKER